MTTIEPAQAVYEKFHEGFTLGSRGVAPTWDEASDLFKDRWRTAVRVATDPMHHELHAIKLAAAGGEDVPGSAHAVTADDVVRYRVEAAEEIERLRVKLNGTESALRGAVKAADDMRQELSLRHSAIKRMRQDVGHLGIALPPGAQQTYGDAYKRTFRGINHFEAHATALCAVLRLATERLAAFWPFREVEATADPIVVDYTNWKGERAHRRITVLDAWWGSEETYHPVSQWLLRCWDHDRGAERIYAQSGIHSWNGQPLAALSPSPAAGGGVREALDEIDVHDEADCYEFRSDADYVPNDFEKTLLEDFGAGLMAKVYAALDRQTGEREGWAGLLAQLRSQGWVVAVHNDYRLAGEARTFWLFTHPDGRWIKGEGRTDEDALLEASLPAAPRDADRAAGQGEGELREALKPFVAHYQPWMDDWAEEKPCTIFATVTFGDLRRARAALASA